jgi:RNA polymerase sigma-70 factor (ECF subfamily)
LLNPAEQATRDRFVGAFQPLVFHWLKRLQVPQNDLEDLVLEVLMHLLDKLASGDYTRTRGHFRAWLWAVVCHKVSDWRRQQQAEVLSRARPLTSATLTEPDPQAALVEAEYRQHFVAQALQIIQTEFNETTVRVFQEYVLQAKPAKEVAAGLGISVNQVYLAKARVLRRLRHTFHGMLD